MKTVELLQALSDEHVQYVLVGGLAVQLHGFLRSTFDIDLVLAMNDENLSRFIAVAQRYNLVPVNPVPIESLRNAGLIEQWHREEGMLAFSLREPHSGGNVVDVLVRPDVPYDRLMANAVAGELFGRKVWIAAIDDLLLMKRVANRPKDRLDIAAPKKSSLEKTQMPESDAGTRAVIPQELMLSRLAQSEQMREFFVQMWLQNPALARQGGARVQSLVSRLARADATIQPS
jgi:hypothetical protein